MDASNRQGTFTRQKSGQGMESDRAFAKRRAQEERLAALKADHPNVRRVHEDLASRYEGLIRLIALREKASAIKSPTIRGDDRTQLWL
jgi:hypothetical protein